MNRKTVTTAFNRFFSTLNREQAITYQELMNLTDRQLEDIGLTRGLIRTVVLQGPQSIRALLPEGAIQANNANANEADRVSAV